MLSHKAKVQLARRMATPEEIRASGGLFKTQAWILRRAQKANAFRSRVARLRKAREEKAKHFDTLMQKKNITLVE